MARPNWYDRIDEDDDRGDDDEWEEPPKEDDTIPCPYCKEPIFDDSVRCPYCDRYLSAEDMPPDPKPWWIRFGGYLCLLIAIMMIAAILALPLGW